MQSLSADDSSTHPHERFSGIGRVRMLGVFYVEVAAEFARCVLHPLVVAFPSGRAEAAIHRLKRPLVRVHITLRNHRRARFEHEHFQATFGQFLRSHAARCARNNDYCVVDSLPGQSSLL